MVDWTGHICVCGLLLTHNHYIKCNEGEIDVHVIQGHWKCNEGEIDVRVIQGHWKWRAGDVEMNIMINIGCNGNCTETFM
jgi:hypothetical protein